MNRLTAIDLFAGAGGATVGLRRCGVEVLGAVEIDDDAANTYAANHPQVFLWRGDIRFVKTPSFRKKLGLSPGELTILKACPPCQGFSTLSGGRVKLDDERNSLVLAITKFAREFKPKFLMLENVPGFAADHRFGRFVSQSEALGYRGRGYLVNAKDFGVPQNRKRFIYLASNLEGVVLPRHLPETPIEQTTVRAAFARLMNCENDALNVSRKLAPVVAARVLAIPAGGCRHDLPFELQLKCHKRLRRGSQRSASGPYGRMNWDHFSPTMTTRCTTVSCGSFIHPELNRGITLREAATLQSFPVSYDFVGTYGSIERQIGNAVPSRLVSGLTRALIKQIGSQKAQKG